MITAAAQYIDISWQKVKLVRLMLIMSLLPTIFNDYDEKKNDIFELWNTGALFMNIQSERSFFMSNLIPFRIVCEI